MDTSLSPEAVELEFPELAPDVSAEAAARRYAGLTPAERALAEADLHMSTEPNIDDCGDCQRTLARFRKLIDTVKPVIEEQARADERRKVFDELRAGADKDSSYEQTYDTFWRDIIEPDGVLNLDQVKRELSDYAWVMEQVAEVYCHITGGRMSKPNYLASGVIAQADDYYQEAYAEDLADERAGLIEDIAAAVEAYEPDAHPVVCPPSVAYAAAMEKAVAIVRGFAAAVEPEGEQQQ